MGDRTQRRIPSKGHVDPFEEVLKELSAPVVGADSTLSRRMIVDDGGIGLGQIENLQKEPRYVGEIEQHLHEKERAAREVGGDEFRQRIQMVRQDYAALQAQAPYVRSNPASAVGKILGNSVTVPNNQQREVARWVGEDEECLPITFTVQAADALTPQLIQTQSVIGVAPTRPYAIAQWGSSGWFMTAEIDICRGTQFTVSASSAILTLAMADMTAVAPGNLAARALTGIISFMPCVRGTPVQRSVYIDALGAGAFSGRIFIPKFARSFTVWRSDSTQTISILLQQADSTAAYSVARAASALETTQTPIYLAGDVTYIQIQNTGAGATDIRIIFDLNL